MPVFIQLQYFIDLLKQVIGIGSKKCSTGALMTYFCSHPKVQCPEKELHYFDQLKDYKKGINFYRSEIIHSNLD